MENEKKVVKVEAEQLGQVAGGTEFVPDIPMPDSGIGSAICPHCMCKLKGTQSEIDAHIASCKGEPYPDINIIPEPCEPDPYLPKPYKPDPDLP